MAEDDNPIPITTADGEKPQDWQPEPYESRHKDSNGNGDDKLTEKEALAQAKDEGIEFIDSWQVEGDDTFYPTEAEAKKKAKGKPITQRRDRKPDPVEEDNKSEGVS